MYSIMSEKLLQQLFKPCVSQQGKISFKNLKRVAKELGENMTDEELQEMIDEADRDGMLHKLSFCYLDQLDEYACWNYSP